MATVRTQKYINDAQLLDELRAVNPAASLAVRDAGFHLRAKDVEAWEVTQAELEAVVAAHRATAPVDQDRLAELRAKVDDGQVLTESERAEAVELMLTRAP